MKRVEKAALISEFSDIEPYVDKFCTKYPEFNKYHMIEDLVRGESVLWKNKDAFIIGRPNIYHNKTMFLIEAAGGQSPEKWIDDTSVIEEEVKAWGFTEIEFFGRLGWRKYVESKGYCPTKIVMRKSLE